MSTVANTNATTEYRYIAGPSDITPVATTYDTALCVWQRSGSGYRAYEAFLAFDVSSIPLGSKIVSATLKLNGIDYATNPNSQDIEVFVAGNWDGVATLATSHWDDLSALSSSDWATDANYSFPTGSYGDVTNNLTAASIATLQAAVEPGGSGVLPFMLANTYAVAGTGGLSFDTWQAAVDVTAVPVLAITYEPAGGMGIALGANF